MKLHLILIALLGCLLAPTPSSAALPPPPPGTPSAWPSGRLGVIGGNPQAIHFLIMDQSQERDGRVDFWILTVWDTPVVLTGTSTVRASVSHRVIDCAAHTDELIADAGFNDEGKRVIWLDPEAPEPIKAGGTGAWAEAAFCRHETQPTEFVVGTPAAIVLTRQRIAAARGG